MFALGVFASGCHFSIAGLSLALIDGGTDDLPAVMDDMGPPPPDLSGLCTSGPQSACSTMDSQQLITCVGPTQTPVTCADGCVSTPTPHCASLDPSGPALPSDYLDPGLADPISINGPVIVNGDTGEINSGGLTRAAIKGVDANIGYRIAPQAGGPDVAVFSFNALTIEPGTTVKIDGTKPVVFVARNDIVVNGTIDVQGTCMPGVAIAGGGMGGAPKAGTGTPGTGTGGGAGGAVFLTDAGGGGGGGFGEVGGNGGGPGLAGGGGAIFGDLTLDNPTLTGGSGGGAGGGTGNTANGGQGGMGGGFIQLASNQTITLGANAILQAGGCHGLAGSGMGMNNGGGGGGGSGGGILIEGRVITISGGAAIVTNGGGGGGGGDGMPGEDGPLDNGAAKGGKGGMAASDGGDGGHTTSLTGSASGGAKFGDHYGGGGGGSVGRIAFKNKAGAVTTTGATLSPIIGEFATHAAPATVGPARFD